MNKHEQEKRLINFSILIIELTNGIPDPNAGNHLAGQLFCSGTSPALYYSETQSGESRKDFVHNPKLH
jgi:four helix bundle protein